MLINVENFNIDVFERICFNGKKKFVLMLNCI